MFKNILPLSISSYKTLLFATALAIGATMAKAQSLQYGVTAGISLTSIEETDPRIGFDIGATAVYNFTNPRKGIFTEASLVLITRNSELLYTYEYAGSNAYDEYKYKNKYCYLMIPIHVGYKLPINSKVSLIT